MGEGRCGVVSGGGGGGRWEGQLKGPLSKAGLAALSRLPLECEDQQVCAHTHTNPTVACCLPSSLFRLHYYAPSLTHPLSLWLCINKRHASANLAVSSCWFIFIFFSCDRVFISLFSFTLMWMFPFEKIGGKKGTTSLASLLIVTGERDYAHKQNGCYVTCGGMTMGVTAGSACS